MIIKTRTNVYAATYHIVFVTKYRQAVFHTKKQQAIMQALLAEIAKEQEITPYAIEVQPDHVYMRVSFPPKYSISDVVKKLKGTSARRWFLDYPETKEQLWRGHLWHGSYFAGTAGEVTRDTITEYIKEQRSQPPE